ncbi:hypothetical protein P167DRAFT_540040 [Morchella conica CCBAS932]|uniref:F-box domain-containing protein n=1 Tax=Morchella conica CCBAS932 TaxID=1392247 RepID=A0A3N4KDW1_9PEZI|nr:hypothetical protein P167DRAFT_540040 [Morchella conica CCBAS932]
MAFADPVPKLPHELMLIIRKHAFTDPALPLELLLIIGEHADTRVLSVLSRTCHALHTLLARELRKRFTTDIEEIAIWAVTSHRPLLLERALTTSLTPLTPGSPIATCRDPLHDTLKRRLPQLSQLSLPVEHRKVETVKILLSHDIIHIPRIRTCTTTTQPSSTRPTTQSRRTRRTSRPLSSAGPITQSPRWSIDGTCATAWMEHAVRHGDLWLARRLLKKAGAKVHGSAVGVQGNQTLLDIARDRRFEKPRGHNVEEMIQLLVDRDPKPSPPHYPGVQAENQEHLEKMLKVSKDPSALLNAWVAEEMEYAYDQLVERGAAVAPGMKRDRKNPGRFRLLPSAYM